MPCARPSTWNVSKMHICNYPPKQLCGLWPFPGSHGTEGALEGHSSLTQGESGPDCPPHGARGYRPPRVPVSALGGGQCHTATPSWPQKCRHGACPWRRADEAVPVGPVCGIASGMRLEPAEAMCPPPPPQPVMDPCDSTVSGPRWAAGPYSLYPKDPAPGTHPGRL